MSEKVTAMIEEIKGLTVLELSDLDLFDHSGNFLRHFICLLICIVFCGMPLIQRREQPLRQSRRERLRLRPFSLRSG